MRPEKLIPALKLQVMQGGPAEMKHWVTYIKDGGKVHRGLQQWRIVSMYPEGDPRYEEAARGGCQAQRQGVLGMIHLDITDGDLDAVAKGYRTVDEARKSLRVERDIVKRLEYLKEKIEVDSAMGNPINSGDQDEVGELDNQYKLMIKARG